MEQNKNHESPDSRRARPRQPSDRPAPLLTHHMPELVDPLVPADPETAFTLTRRLRHDGWTPEKKRLFLERFAECGVFVEACEAAGMSARAAYNLRDRDPVFAAGLDAASVKARAPLADEAYSRARNGVVERIYRDGVIVAERHRYDNRLTMAVLARLDSRIDRAEEKGAAHLALVSRWDDYLDAVGDDRGDDALAILSRSEAAPAAPEAGPGENPRDHELRELHQREDPMDKDLHTVREEEDGWWTDYPPPPGFDGDEQGKYGDLNEHYRRRLSPAEQAVVDSEIAEEDAEDLARAEDQRDAWFGFRPRPAPEAEGGDEDPDPPEPVETDESPRIPGSRKAPGSAAQVRRVDDHGESDGHGKGAEAEDDEGSGGGDEGSGGEDDGDAGGSGDEGSGGSGDGDSGGEDDGGRGPAAGAPGAGARPPTPTPPPPPPTG